MTSPREEVGDLSSAVRGELLPCPFCGNAAFVWDIEPSTPEPPYTRIGCGGCAVGFMRHGDPVWVRPELFKQWNGRACLTKDSSK